ncbi:MAG: S8 family serine peptidase, partial [Anaerolineae bacterium]
MRHPASLAPAVLLSAAVVAVVAGLLAALGAPPPAGPAFGIAHSEPAAPGASDPRLSAYVVLDGPSAYERASRIAASLRDDPGGSAWGDVAGEEGLGPHLTPLGTEEVAALDSAVARRQEAVIDAAASLGATVVSRYTTGANGLLVHATADQLAALSRVPGVARIEPAPLLRPDLGYSAPHVGAPQVAQALGYDGEGTVIAVIDTGIDYTHAHLGGPGTPDAWVAASAEGASEVITDTFEGELLFPTAKVIGGWDFVGRHYDPPHICTPDREAAGECTSVPHPDPDPIDGGSHGTHVSGIAAGNAVADLSDGVAPGARLVGLKVYGHGGADEAADMVVDAIEWCTRVNLGLEDRGVTPPRVDAINISLGESYAQGSRLFDDAVEAATGTGIVVVSSAGNSGDYSLIVGAPSASPLILSVANSLPPAPGLQITLLHDGQSEVHFATESSIAQPLTESGPITETLAWFGGACDGDEVFQDPTGQIALVRRGVCVFSEKLLNAQSAGAIAVLMFTDDRPRTAMAGDGTGITIPAVMIDHDPGEALAELVGGGAVVTAVLDAGRVGLDTTLADSIAGSSSRGPSKNGALKPDITAPGSGILSALRGTGTGGAAWSGTSMSGPHVAGGAALMHNRNRAEGLGLDGADLAALLMNYARPAAFTGTADSKTLVPVARQGAGVMDLRRAAVGPLLVRAGDIASLNVGAVSLTRLGLSFCAGVGT